MIIPRPAGFWIRVVAALVDLVVFALVNASFDSLAVRILRVSVDDDMGLRSAAGASTVLFVFLYVVVLHAIGGQTIGKLVTGVRVVGADGEPPPFGACVLRFFAYLASLIPFGLGFVMAGLRADRRALHDLLAGTRVERLRGARASELPPREDTQEWISS